MYRLTIAFTTSILLSCVILTNSQSDGINMELPLKDESSLEVETEAEVPAKFICTTLAECQQKVQELEQENQDLREQLDNCNSSEEEMPIDEEMLIPEEAFITEELSITEEMVITEEGGVELLGGKDSPKIYDSFVTTSLGLNYYTVELLPIGTFYVSAEVTEENEYASIYLSSTCDCNSSAIAIPATESNNCRYTSYVGESGLAETVSKKCTVYYTIDSPSSPVSVSVWFFPLKALPRETPTKLNFPYADSLRTYIETIDSQETPVTFYLRAFGQDTFTSINIYVTADCFNSCLDSASYTQFPTDSSYCWTGNTDSAESSFSLSLTEHCNIYYSIQSSQRGESVQATVSVYKIETLKNSTETTIYYPIPNDYRTFYQDIKPYQIFYLSAYGTEMSTNIDIYATSNCTEACVEGTSNTVFPTYDRYCWYSYNTFHFEANDKPCRVYYSLYSSYAKDAVKARMLLYPLEELPRNVLNLIYFPFDGAYRWFYADISASEGRSEPGEGEVYFNISAFATDSAVTPYIRMSTDCTTNCFESSGFTQYPFEYTYCASESEVLTVDLSEAHFPCRIYYSLESSKFGEKINVRTTLRHGL